MSAAVLAGAAAPGCVYHRIVTDPWSDFRQYADHPSTATDNNPSTPAEPKGWAIHIAQLQGEDAQQRARNAIKFLADHANVPDLWYQKRGDTVDLYRGRYLNPTHENAQSDLRQTRMLVINGKRPYQQVELVPLIPAGGDHLPMHPTDLRKHSGMYTLQIGFFDDSSGESFREAAEHTVESLRKNGVEAFFYHGPNRSLITTGLFTYEQAFVVGSHGQDEYSPGVLELQKRFPCNLGNGVSLELQQQAKQRGAPGSFLVQVP